MTNTFADNTNAAPLVGNEIIGCVGDPAGTAYDGRFTPADIATYLGSGTGITGLTLSWDAVDGITIGTGQCYTESGDAISVSSAIALTSLSLSASTWYHVYVYLSGGSPAAEVVTTAPVAWLGTAYSKTGDTSRRYVGSILTNGSSSIYNFFHHPQSNYAAYRNFESIGSPFRVLNGGTAATATAIDLSGVIPVTSALANAKFLSTANQDLYISENGSVSATQRTIQILASTGNQDEIMPISTDGSRQIFYKFAAAPTGGAYVYVLGYYFNR